MVAISCATFMIGLEAADAPRLPLVRRDRDRYGQPRAACAPQRRPYWHRRAWRARAETVSFAVGNQAQQVLGAGIVGQRPKSRLYWHGRRVAVLFNHCRAIFCSGVLHSVEQPEARHRGPHLVRRPAPIGCVDVRRRFPTSLSTCRVWFHDDCWKTLVGTLHQIFGCWRRPTPPTR